MEERVLRCQIITPEKIVYEGEVEMVIAPGVDGELGILPLHAPIITTLAVGELRLKRDNKQDYIAIEGGYLEVKEDKVTVLADSAEIASKIDVSVAEQAKREAEERLGSAEPGEDEFLQASQDLQRAANRLRVAEKK